MLLVVFGAGASYDSVPHRPLTHRNEFRLPLANELFADRTRFSVWIQRFPTCNAVIPYLRQPSEGGSVESELERLRTEAQANSNRIKQLAAVQFYLQSMLWECETLWNQEDARGVTNYKTLLDQIESWRIESKEKVCLVTFNYDTMLEDALPVVGIKIGDLPDYIASNDYKIIKLHGSVNWAHKVHMSASDVKDIIDLTCLDVANDLIERRAWLRILPDFHIIKGPLGEPERRHPSESPSFPALAIPVEKKQEYECPQDHLQALRDCIPEVTKILLIGWRATEINFLQLLSENLHRRVHMMAAAGNETSARESVERLVQSGIQGALHVAKSGFSDFVTRREVDDFLRLT